MDRIIKNSLFDLLKTFNKNEIKELEDFTRNPFFNSDQSLIKLLDGLGRLVLKGDVLNIKHQCSIYNKMFDKYYNAPLDKNSTALWNAKTNLLYELVKKYLIVKNTVFSSSASNTIFLKELLKRKQFNICKRAINKSKKALLKQEKIDIEFYEQVFHLEENYLTYLHQERLLKKQNNIAAINSNLDLYFILNKLKIYSTALSLDNISSKKIANPSDIQSIQTLLNIPLYKSNPIVQIYLTIIKLMQENKDEDYFQLINLIDQYEQAIPVNKLNDFYTVALNYGVQQIIRGNLKFFEYQFDLYKILDKKGLLLENDLMDIQRMKNIINLCCRLQKFEWGFHFLNKFKSKLRHKDSESIYNFNLGILEYYQGHYKKAISNFIRVNKVNLSYDLDCKIMLIKSYYELDEDYDERTMTIFRTTEQFVANNKKLYTKKKTSFKNFIKILINLYKIKHRSSKRTIQTVELKLNEMKLVSDKKWLLSKIDLIK